MSEWGVVIILLILLCLLIISTIIEIHNKESDKKLKISAPVVIVFILTFGWLLNIYFLSFQNGYSNYIGEYFSITVNKNGLQLNEWGDYFAGFFAPVIFLWIVVGVYIQQSEFRNAVEEYRESLKFLERQSVNTDIQQRNIWFDRNVDILEKYIDNLNKHESNDKNTLQDLNKAIIDMTISGYVKLLPILLLIVELDKHISDTLSKVKEEKKEQEFKYAIDELLKGYNILFKKDILSCKYIVLKMFLYAYYSKIMLFIDKSYSDDNSISPILSSLNIITDRKSEVIESILSSLNIKINKDYIDLSFVDLYGKFTEEQIFQIIYEEN